jgi:hypothetical protein
MAGQAGFNSADWPPQFLEAGLKPASPASASAILLCLSQLLARSAQDACLCMALNPHQRLICRYVSGNWAMIRIGVFHRGVFRSPTA